MNRRLPATLFILFIALSCAAPHKQKPARVPAVHSLEHFLRACISDIERAGRVIVEKDLVKNLTRLRDRNAGGTRYYLLERESITGMIKAVTEDIYTDFILINDHGTIIYTRNNDELFGKNVRSGLRESVIRDCYRNRAQGLFIGDVAHIIPDRENYYLTLSKSLSGGLSYPGVFILQVDIRKIETFLDRSIHVVGHDGLYRIARDHNLIYSACGAFQKIDRRFLQGGPSKVSAFISSRGPRFDLFSFYNLQWIIMSDR